MLEQPDDATLLIIASRGDSEGFRQLFHRHYEAVFCFAYRLSGSVSAAEEITQDCFLSLLQHPVRYNASRGSLKTYVYGIARNLFLKQLRRSGLDVNLEDSGAIIRRHEGLDPGSWIGCGSHSGQIFGNLIEQVVEGCPKTREGDAQNGD